MRFAEKLFALMMVLLTVIFTVFGTWMLSSYFFRTLNRETEAGIAESRMLQWLFDLSYQSVKEYGVEYAVANSMENISANFEGSGSKCFAIDTEGDFYHDDSFYYGSDVLPSADYREDVRQLYSIIDDDYEFSYGIRHIEGKVFFFGVSKSEVQNGEICLGLCRDITRIYTDRDDLLNQYRFALVCLICIGSISIYMISRYVTGPIRILEKVTGEIAGGNLERRSHYRSKDELGRLSDSLNMMADKISEQMNELLEEAKKKELEAKQKEDFTAAFAHELKTPLTSIIGYADMLNTIELSEEEKRDAYFYIFNQGKRLESLSHKLLELVSMEKDQVEQRPIQTRQIEENLKSTMRPIFEKKGINGKITLEKAVIYGDYELLLSLFYNLLDNSVKAVERDGFILFKGSRTPEGYQIKVVDNGRGIPENEISRITEAFYMVDKSRSRKEGGAGIGMALCQKIINLHGAVMQIASKVEEGTVISVTFPLKPIQTESGVKAGEKQ